MPQFYKVNLGFNDLAQDNRVLRLSKSLELIENSEFKTDLLELFNFEDIKNETITIRGLTKVIETIIEKDRLYQKKDISSHISDVSYIEFIDQNTIKLRFRKPEGIEAESIDAKTVYSAKREYFEGFYKMDKFANFCISEGHTSLLKNNIDYLNKEYAKSDSHLKNFRLLIDKEGEYFVRAITSTSHYFDYNIRFSLFVTIIALYDVMKRTNLKFEVRRCEYSESFIRLYFQKDNPTQIPDVGQLSFILEMSNDEIKREAFKFSGLFTLTTTNNNERANVFLKPKRIKTKLISIKHNFKPPTVIEHLKELGNFIQAAEKEMRNDIIELQKVKNPDHLRFFLLRKIELSKNRELSKYKEAIKEKLDVKINKINELLFLMGKVDELVTELDLKEYLRYLFYEILRNKKETN